MKGAPGTCLPLPRADGFVTREPRQVGAPLRGGGPLPGTVCPWAPRREVATHHHCQGASRDKQNSLWNNSRQRLPCVPQPFLLLGEQVWWDWGAHRGIHCTSQVPRW